MVSRNEARERGAAMLGQPLGGILFGIGRGVPFLFDALTYDYRPVLWDELAHTGEDLERSGQVEQRESRVHDEGDGLLLTLFFCCHKGSFLSFFRLVTASNGGSLSQPNNFW